jgi:hypothetical protein
MKHYLFTLVMLCATYASAGEHAIALPVKAQPTICEAHTLEHLDDLVQFEFAERLQFQVSLRQQLWNNPFRRLREKPGSEIVTGVACIGFGFVFWRPWDPNDTDYFVFDEGDFDIIGISYAAIGAALIIDGVRTIRSNNSEEKVQTRQWKWGWEK